MSPRSSLVISDTAAHAGLSTFAITCVTNVVFTTLTTVSGFAGVTFPAGMTLYGNFETIKLASGTVVAYSL